MCGEVDAARALIVPPGAAPSAIGGARSSGPLDEGDRVGQEHVTGASVGLIAEDVDADLVPARAGVEGHPTLPVRAGAQRPACVGLADVVAPAGLLLAQPDTDQL